MDNKQIAEELVKVAKELISRKMPEITGDKRTDSQIEHYFWEEYHNTDWSK